MPNAKLFWPLVFTLFLMDCTTKELAETHLTPAHVPHDVLGNIVRFTLTYNQGAAMGIPLGPAPRRLLAPLGLAVLLMLWWFYRRTAPGDRWQVLALALLCGGAIGNLFDRVRSSSGVVDFIDLGLGPYRFWTFNVADMGVTAGAALLAFLLWRRDAVDRLPTESGRDLPR